VTKFRDERLIPQGFCVWLRFWLWLASFGFARPFPPGVRQTQRTYRIETQPKLGLLGFALDPLSDPLSSLISLLLRHLEVWDRFRSNLWVRCPIQGLTSVLSGSWRFGFENE
jgi:hypothetical protein